jgi:hypothetical protein
MTIRNMVRQYSDGQDRGSWYNARITQASGIVSDTYMLPVAQVYAIGATISGTNAKLAFSLNSLTDVTVGSGLFIDWDGSAQINLAVTAFKMTTTTASGFGNVMVKTVSAN